MDQDWVLGECSNPWVGVASTLGLGQDENISGNQAQASVTQGLWFLSGINEERVQMDNGACNNIHVTVIPEEGTGLSSHGECSNSQVESTSRLRHGKDENQALSLASQGIVLLSGNDEEKMQVDDEPLADINGCRIPEGKGLTYGECSNSKAESMSILRHGKDENVSQNRTQSLATRGLTFLSGTNEGKMQMNDGTCSYIDDPAKLGEGKRLSSGDPFDHLPDHVMIEVLIRLPVPCWVSVACVRKKWASLFRSEMLFLSALAYRWPYIAQIRKWPGPIGCTSHKRRYIALHISQNLFSFKDQDIHELVGHAYLYLKEQLEDSSPSSYGLLHGTIIDQFLACGKQGSVAHELASQIWLAVIDNLDDSEKTFHLLMRIVEEWEVFPPYPYSKSHVVQWKLFERLFTDFRDCLGQLDYFSILSKAKHKFDFIPSTWLGY